MAEQTAVRTIRVLPYDPAWAELFRQEAASLRDVFGESLVSIHHIGSTSVTGMMAKPIIDILMETHDINCIDDSCAVLERNGYITKGEFGIPGRRFFIKGTETNRSHHLHVFETGDAHIKKHLAFRDYLLAHEHSARYYSELKRMLAMKYPHDIEAYIEGKKDFIQNILNKTGRT